MEIGELIKKEPEVCGLPLEHNYFTEDDYITITKCPDEEHPVEYACELYFDFDITKPEVYDGFILTRCGTVRGCFRSLSEAVDYWKEIFKESSAFYSNFVLKGFKYQRGAEMIRCFHCGGEIVWDNDFTLEECGYEGNGIVHMCHCNKCGAQIEYRITDQEDED